MHVHNVKTNLEGEMEYTYHPGLQLPESIPPEIFQGFLHRNNRSAIQTEIWIIPTVGHVNDVAKRLARSSQDLVSGSIKGLYTFIHSSSAPRPVRSTPRSRKLLAALVLSLGCENLIHDQLLGELGATTWTG